MPILRNSLRWLWETGRSIEIISPASVFVRLIGAYRITPLSGSGGPTARIRDILLRPESEYVPLNGLALKARQSLRSLAY